MRLEIDVRGEEDVVRRFAWLAEHAERARPFFERAARILFDESRRRFARQPWVPLDPDTIRRKARQGQDPRILRASGALERALTQRGAPGQRLDFDRDELVFGLNHRGVAYHGRFHHTGRGVPRRPLFGVTGRTRRLVRGALLDHLGLR